MGGDQAPSTGISFQYADSYQLTVSLSDNRTWSITPNDLPGNRWSHVTITWHESWGLKYYVNGNYLHGTNKWTRKLPANVTVANRIVIGGGESTMDGVSSLGANLQMSDLRVWERYLSPAHVKEKYEKSGTFFEFITVFRNHLITGLVFDNLYQLSLVLGFASLSLKLHCSYFACMYLCNKKWGAVSPGLG